MAALESLRKVAAARLTEYTDPWKAYAFATYDRRPLDLSSSLTAEDVLAANLLSLRLTAGDVTPLFAQGNGPAQQLLAAMNAAKNQLTDVGAYETYETWAGLEEVLRPLREANIATEKVKGWTAVTVSKVLHRHLPHIVPIVDSRVRTFYGLPKRDVAGLRARLHADLRANRGWLTDLAGRFPTPDGQPLSLLRTADIIIWTRTPGGPTR